MPAEDRRIDGTAVTEDLACPADRTTARSRACNRARARFFDNRGDQTTAPGGSYPSSASPFGVLDLAGNVWEWTNSLHWPYPYSADDGREWDHPEASGQRVIRGGSWNNGPSFLRTTARSGNYPGIGDDTVGFRCVRGR